MSMQFIKQFLTSTETPRWHSYLVSSLTIVFTVAFTLVGNNWKNKDDVRLSEEKALTDSMIQFQIHASSFASSIMDGTGDVEKQRSVLLENLNEQFARAKQAEPYIKSHSEAWQNFENAITALRDVVDKTSSVKNMGPFWTAASKLLVARNRLREQIKQNI